MEQIPEKPIYPEVKIETAKVTGAADRMKDFFHNVNDQQVVKLETYLRLKHRGKYYLCKFKRTFYTGIDDLTIASVSRGVSQFHAEVYRGIVFMKVDLKMVHSDHNTPVFELDPDQTDEKERLTPNTSPV